MQVFVCLFLFFLGGGGGGEGGGDGGYQMCLVEIDAHRLN